MNRGHVFVAHGDLLELACDSVLVPTDENFHVGRHWNRWKLSPEDAAQIQWRGRVTEPVTIGDQQVRYVKTGADRPEQDVKWLREGVGAALAAAATDLDTRVALHRRERPLIAMPIIGVGAGGFDHQRGSALEAVLEEAHDATVLGIDVAVICKTRADYSAVQFKRPDSHWSRDLTDVQLKEADDLGHKVQHGEAALFLGAGVSMAAGLPDWSSLLLEIAHDSGYRGSGFSALTSSDPLAAASQLQEHLGEQFRQAIRDHLPDVPYAVGHALLASLRVDEVITTNVDALYEKAAHEPFEGRLKVLPWGRSPGRPPWLLKMHGDLEEGNLVFTAEQYELNDQENGPLGAIVQALLVTRHLVFVGYSLRDADFMRLADEVARILHGRKASHTEVGTVLSVTPTRTPEHPWEHDLHVVQLGDEVDGVSPADARNLEIFLDRMAWRAARVEASWLLDQRYASLLDGDELQLVRALQELEVPDKDPRWHDLRHLLRAYGREDMIERHRAGRASPPASKAPRRKGKMK